MADKSKIEWTDATWNPIRGCTRVSEGCRNCYAERTAARFRGPGQPYEGLVTLAREPGEESKGDPRWTGAIQVVPQLADQPLRWKRPRRIFVNSMSDLFHEKVSTYWIDVIFAVMAFCPRHTFQILTKRPGVALNYLKTTGVRSRILNLAYEAMGHYPKYKHGGVMNSIFPLPNVWLGVSVEDQKTADERIPLLLQTPAAVRWVSYEPALGPVDFTKYLTSGWKDIITGKWYPHHPKSETLEQDVPILDWLVAGGESGPGARPAHPDWFRSVRDQCQAAGVPFFFKQWGEWLPIDQFPKDEKGDPVDPAHPRRMYQGLDLYATQKCGFVRCVRVGKKLAGHLLDGETWQQFPGVR